MSAKCIECANATDEICPKCSGQVPLCVDREAYQNTCTHDHHAKAHAAPAQSRSEANILVKALRGDVAQLKHDSAIQHARDVNAAAAANERAVNAQASWEALAKFLRARMPDIADQAQSLGLMP
jgi:hypothetical protein